MASLDRTMGWEKRGQTTAAGAWICVGVYERLTAPKQTRCSLLSRTVLEAQGESMASSPKVSLSWSSPYSSQMRKRTYAHIFLFLWTFPAPFASVICP